MKNNDFAKHLTEFITHYMPNMQNLSENTISSYCDTYRMFLTYLRDAQNKQIEKLAIADLSHANVTGFLEYLEKKRSIGASTRNQRLSAINAFVRYLQADFPNMLLEFQKILNIPPKKKTTKPVKYLSTDEMQAILEQPDLAKKQGRRDATIISVLYDTGARVHELCKIKVNDVRLTDSASIKLRGKGDKIRLVPLLPNTASLLKAYLEENRLTTPDKGDYPLFVNRVGNKLTRAGVAYILNKASTSAQSSSTIQKKVTPHLLRHTKAMHTYEAGANIIYVRDILGHADIKTTNVYAKASLKMKREAMGKVANSPTVTMPSWIENKDLVDWLKDYCKTTS